MLLDKVVFLVLRIRTYLHSSRKPCLGAKAGLKMAARWETDAGVSMADIGGMRVAVGACSMAAMHDDKDGRMASALGFGSHTRKSPPQERGEEEAGRRKWNPLFARSIARRVAGEAERAT
jgi:hypothetical protein